MASPDSTKSGSGTDFRETDGTSLVERTATAMIARTLAKPEWTHHAHLRTGLWHVVHHGPDEAIVLLRERIRALNESHGVANTPTGGYHETITRFYVWRIASVLDGVDRSRSLDDLAEELIREHGDKNLPLEWWSKERLFSAEARFGWVEPDLRPLA